MTGYIEDGYNLAGYIAPAPETKSGERLYDALEFVYRPATRTELIRHDAEVRAAMCDEYKDPEAFVRSEQLASEFAAKHLLSWNLKDSKSRVVPCTVEAMGRIHVGLFDALYRIIRGMRTSDPKMPGELPSPSDAEQLGN